MSDLPLTICEWEVCIAAYAYEFMDSPTMTDASYDRLCEQIAVGGSGIPGFGAETGQWVHGLDTKLLGNLWELALSVNDGKQDLHTPAVLWALDHENQAYRCCHDDLGFNCWEGE